MGAVNVDVRDADGTTRVIDPDKEAGTEYDADEDNGTVRVEVLDAVREAVDDPVLDELGLLVLEGENVPVFVADHDLVTELEGVQLLLTESVGL